MAPAGWRIGGGTVGWSADDTQTLEWFEGGGDDDGYNKGKRAGGGGDD